MVMSNTSNFDVDFAKQLNKTVNEEVANINLEYQQRNAEKVPVSWIIIIAASCLSLIAICLAGFFVYRCMSRKRSKNLDLPKSKNNAKEISQLKKLYGSGMQKSNSNSTLTDVNGQYGLHKSESDTSLMDSPSISLNSIVAKPQSQAGKFASKDFYEVGRMKKMGSLQDVAEVASGKSGR